MEYIDSFQLSHNCTNQTIDYFSSNLSEYQLFNCWKIITAKNNQTNSSTAVKNHKYAQTDFDIPSTNPKRLENISWRKWYKNKFNLGEMNPGLINWYKDSDVTWLYGPLIKDDDFIIDKKSETKDENKRRDSKTHYHKNELEREEENNEMTILNDNEFDNDSDFEVFSSSIESDASFKFSQNLPIMKTAATKEISEQANKLKSILKKKNPFYLKDCVKDNTENGSRGNFESKKVKFDFFINKREIINNIKFDYIYFEPL